MDYKKLTLEELAVRIRVAGEDERSAFLLQCAMLAEIRSRFISTKKYEQFLITQNILQDVGMKTRSRMLKINAIETMYNLTPLSKPQIIALSLLANDKVEAAYNYAIENPTSTGTVILAKFRNISIGDVKSSVSRKNKVITNLIIEVLTDALMSDKEAVTLLGNVKQRVLMKSLANAKYTIEPLRNGLVDTPAMT